MRWLTNCDENHVVQIMMELGYPRRNLVKGEPMASESTAPLADLKKWGLVGIYEVEQ